MTQRPEYLTSPLFADAGFSHAFFTRRGGVSQGPYSSLNFSVSVGDTEGAVSKNLELAARALGVEPERVFCLSQVHGNQTVTLRGAERREEVLERRGDALVSGAPDLACAVRTADCVPILLADRSKGAVAAVHAGWRGVVAGVVSAAVSALDALARGNYDLIAAIGPHISQAAFEVSEDVAEQLLAVAPGLPGVADRSAAKPCVSLRVLVRAELERAGLRPEAVDDVPGCTVGDAHFFYSYRRDGPRSGRHLSAIVPKR